MTSLAIATTTRELLRVTKKPSALRLYNHARKSRKEHHWSTYKSHKKSTTKALNKARIDYINGILQAGLDKGNSKPFWHYIFSQRNDRGSVAALKEDGKVHTGGQKKAEILNKQFTSVFSVDKLGSDTILSRPSYPPIDRLLISIQGVEKLLTGINPNKAAGPDQVPCHILKELSTMESHLGFYSAFPDIGNYFPISGIRIPDIGKWFPDIGNSNFGYREM